MKHGPVMLMRYGDSLKGPSVMIHKHCLNRCCGGYQHQIHWKETKWGAGIVAINNVYLTTPPLGGVEKNTSAVVSEMETSPVASSVVVQAVIAISFTT